MWDETRHPPRHANGANWFLGLDVIAAWVISGHG